jgi:hypothetical protein
VEYESVLPKESLRLNDATLERASAFVAHLRREYAGTDMNILLCTHLSCVNVMFNRDAGEAFPMGGVAELS